MLECDQLKKTRTVQKYKNVTEYRTLNKSKFVIKKHPDTFRTEIKKVIRYSPSQYYTKYRDEVEIVKIPRNILLSYIKQ